MSSDALPKNFDPDSYRLAYPDVALSGLDPKTHYLKYGKLFGRSPNPDLVPDVRPVRLRYDDPAMLDLRYAQGIIPQSEPIRHSELVTILMPSHNNELWLTRALHAALSQQGVAVEVILIDDGSTDGSVSVARRIAQTARNLKVISLLRNFGCYYARNVGVMHAKGDYVTILDTDDIMRPDRIARQLDALKAAEGVVACRCRQRRWTPDYTAPVSELKDGENSLLWRRDVLNRVGCYDTVRFSGDGEFRFRLEKTFGVASVLKMEEELYFTRTLENSLTTSRKSRVFTLQEGQLALTMSPPRKKYREGYMGWHTSGAKLRTTFPQFSRPFELGAPAQNASPSLGQARIGAMASIPEHRTDLQETLTALLPQLDELRLYLNGYDDVPDFARHPKIRAVLSQTAQGDLGDTGRFQDLSVRNAYIFTFDERLSYPADYIAQMIYRIEMLGRACVVGVCGETFPGSKLSTRTQRKIFDFEAAYIGQFVDLLATGAMAWHSSCLQPVLDDFETQDQSDLWFAAIASRSNVPLFIVPRPENWVVAKTPSFEALGQEAGAKKEVYLETYNNHIAPVVGNGRVRRQMVNHLARCYDSDTLWAADIMISKSARHDVLDLVNTRRSTNYLNVRPAPNSSARARVPNFHIVVVGWNCIDHLTACIRSIAQQLPGAYTFDVTLVDDGSDDGTYEDLAALAILPLAKLVRVTRNTGSAHARHLGITAVQDPDTIIVVLDMDDALEPGALRAVADCYTEMPECLMTLGNWHDQNGEKNPHGPYTPEEIDAGQIRARETFQAPHLCTFRRHLYDAIGEADLCDPAGKWLESATDAALVYPLLEQCRANEVVFIDAPIYRHTRDHDTTIEMRFGAQHKAENLKWLRSKPPKLRITERET